MQWGASTHPWVNRNVTGNDVEGRGGGEVRGGEWWSVVAWSVEREKKERERERERKGEVKPAGRDQLWIPFGVAYHYVDALSFFDASPIICFLRVWSVKFFRGYCTILCQSISVFPTLFEKKWHFWPRQIHMKFSHNRINYLKTNQKMKTCSSSISSASFAKNL